MVLVHLAVPSVLSPVILVACFQIMRPAYFTALRTSVAVMYRMIL